MRTNAIDADHVKELVLQYFDSIAVKGSVPAFIRWADTLDPEEKGYIPSSSWIRIHLGDMFKDRSVIMGESFKANNKEYHSFLDFVETIAQTEDSLYSMTRNFSKMAFIRDKYDDLISSCDFGYIGDIFDGLTERFTKFFSDVESEELTFQKELVSRDLEIAEEERKRDGERKLYEEMRQRKPKAEDLEKYYAQKRDGSKLEHGQADPIKWSNRPSVYTLYGADGEVLYVGKSTHLAARLKKHFEGRFGPIVSSVGIKQYPTKSDMDIAEIHTIQSKSPIYNKDCNRSDPPKLIKISGDVDEIILNIDAMPPAITDVITESNSHYVKKPESILIMAKGCNYDFYDRNRIYRWERVESEQKNPCPSCWIELVPEPENAFDPNAIKIMCKGECFGMLGYVAKEDTDRVWSLVEKGQSVRVDCLDVEVVDRDCIGGENILLKVS